LYYLVRNEAWLREVFRISAPVELWFGILPVSAGAFGVPAGFAICVLVSLLTPAPAEEQRAFVRGLRYPRQG
jgi:cation/acetate symporter